MHPSPSPISLSHFLTYISALNQLNKNGHQGKRYIFFIMFCFPCISPLSISLTSALRSVVRVAYLCDIRNFEPRCQIFYTGAFGSEPSTLSLFFWRHVLYVLLYPLLLFLSVSLSISLIFVSCCLSAPIKWYIFVPPSSRCVVFRERLSGLCSHCWRFGLQQNFENLDVEEEAGNVVVDEVGPLMYNGLFIGRGGTISCKDQKC